MHDFLRERVGAVVEQVLKERGLAEPTAAAGASLAPPDPLPEADAALATYIDHTLLKPDATAGQIAALCAEAREHVFVSVCVNGGWVRHAAAELLGSEVRVCTVVGFPLGAGSKESKAAEAALAVDDGAAEVDMVLAVGRLKSGDYRWVEEDIRGVVDAAEGRMVKVIIETALLSGEEKRTACVLAKAAGAHFVKTCTGFSGGAATEEDVRLMRGVVGKDMGVKASGGVRDAAGARALLAAGASRLGASAGVAIVTGGAAKGSY